MILKADAAGIDQRGDELVPNSLGVVLPDGAGVAGDDETFGHGLLVKVLQRLGELRAPFGLVLRVRGRVFAFRRDIAAGGRVGFAAQRAFVEMSVFDPVRVFISHRCNSRRGDSRSRLNRAARARD